MKKFNPLKELESVQNRRNYNISNYMIPILVICCSFLAMIGYTFSSKLIMEENMEYRIVIDFVKGDKDSYFKKVHKGAFADKIELSKSVKSFSCSEGKLDFDSFTGAISSENVTGNIYCTLEYEDVAKYLDSNMPTISDNNGISMYYPGTSVDNYIKVNGLLFRIVRFNGDGTIRIILNESIFSSSYGNTLNYTSSGIRKQLKNWFNTYFEGKSYVVASDYDVTNYQEYYLDNLINFDGYLEDKVGLLSVKEMALILGDANKTYLDGVNGMYLGNGHATDGVWYYRNGKLDVVKPNVKLSIRPVINISVSSLDGVGTINNPYTFKED